MFSGSFVALITPFLKRKVDERALKSLVKFHIESGTNGLVPCGTTGEAATLSDEERERVISIVVREARGRIPVVAGTGTNDTAHAIRLTKNAQKLGADAALLVTPYYNKPTQEGLFQHYRAIARAVDIKQIIYNVPSRTSVNILPQTVLRLMKECKNIVGIKEASGSADQATEILKGADEKFFVLSGDDSMTLPLMVLGARGVISVVANIAPRDVSDMCQAVLCGDWNRARYLHMKLYSLTKACFLETNPISVKTASRLLGLTSGEMRLPLCPMSAYAKEKLTKEMISYGLLKKRK